MMKYTIHFHLLRVHGPVEGALVERVPDLAHDGRVGLLEPGQHVVVHVLVEDDAAEGGATLARGANACECG